MNRDKIPLHIWHERQGAQITEVDGIKVPYSFGRIQQEYAALRQGAALVDLCHHTRYRVEGNGSLDFLNQLLTNRFDDMRPGQTLPAFMCNDRGGILDSFRVYRDAAYWLLIGSPAVQQRTNDWINRQIVEMKIPDVRFSDATETQGHLALLGPTADTALHKAAFGASLDLEKGQSALVSIGATRALILRRDFRPLDGYDVIMGSLYIQPVWERLFEIVKAAGAQLAGAGAQEILRIESVQPRIGIEIDDETTPLEVNATDRVDFRKRAFLGRRALMHSTSGEYGRQLVCLRVEPTAEVTRGSDVFFETMPIGRVTSVTDSPASRNRIALAFVSTLKSIIGTRLRVATAAGDYSNAEVIRAPVPV